MISNRKHGDNIQLKREQGNMENEEQRNQTSRYPAPAIQFALSPDQALYINSLLPAFYSLRPVSSSLNRDERERSGSNIKQNPKRFKAKEQMGLGKGILNGREELQVKKSRKHRKPSPKGSAINIISYEDPENVNNSNMEVEKDWELLACDRLLEKLKKHPLARPFFKINPPTPPYSHKFTEEHIDLSIMQTNLLSSVYETGTQFHADICKMFANSYRLNEKGTEAHRATTDLERYYAGLVQATGGFYSIFKVDSIPTANSKRPGDISSSMLLQRRKTKTKTKPTQTLSQTQIHQLQGLMRQVPKTCTAQILKIITESRVNLRQHIRNIHDLDLHELQPAALIELDRFVRHKVGPRRKKSSQRRGPRSRSVSEFDPDIER